MTFSTRQFTAIIYAERTSSVVSLTGTALVLGTFVSSKSFRKPLNRLVMLATCGNIMANMATLISRSGIERGDESALCQFQAFLIQWFMPADALWTLCMAFNVYLTFFHQYNSSQLRKLEWKYFSLCYGVPFISAFVFLFVDVRDKGSMYGSADLWCWIAKPWNTFPPVIFYGPLWLVILLTFAIYIRAGVEIFKQRNTLRDLHENIAVDLPVHSSYQNQTSRLIQTLARPAPSIDIEHAWALGPAHHHDFDPSGIDKDIVLYSKRGFDPEHPTGRPGAYSIPVEQDLAIPRQETDRPHTSPVTEPLEPLAKRDTIISVTARAYFKYALLYFVALIVTWVPSTINRAYGFVHPDNPSFCLSFTSALVLPLQGFWNSLIYTAVSWPLVRQLFARLWRGGWWQQRRRSNSTNSTENSGRNLLSSAWVRHSSQDSDCVSRTESSEETHLVNRDFGRSP